MRITIGKYLVQILMRKSHPKFSTKRNLVDEENSNVTVDGDLLRNVVAAIKRFLMTVGLWRRIRIWRLRLAEKQTFRERNTYLLHESEAMSHWLTVASLGHVYWHSLKFFLNVTAVTGFHDFWKLCATLFFQTLKQWCRNKDMRQYTECWIPF